MKRNIDLLRAMPVLRDNCTAYKSRAHAGLFPVEYFFKER